jgi:hypothetical protein
MFAVLFDFVVAGQVRFVCWVPGTLAAVHGSDV